MLLPIVAVALAGLALSAFATSALAMPNEDGRDRIQDSRVNKPKIVRVCGERRKFICYNPQNPSTCTYGVVRDCWYSSR